MSEPLVDVRTDPKMLEALRRIAPGTNMRQGINDILRGDLGALIVIGEPAELSFLFSGGIRLDQSFSPYLLYELAKMDGAIILNAMATRIVYANVQLMPDPTIPSAETGTRHRTAERVAKQTGALVISISQQRDVVTLYVSDARYQLEEISDVLAKTNQAVTTLETYRARFDQVSTRLTALEFQGAAMLDDVLVALQRAEMTSRMRSEIERNVVELGVEGRLIKIQLDEMSEWVPGDEVAMVRDYCLDEVAGGYERALAELHALPDSQLLEIESLAELLGYPARSRRSTTRSRPAGTASCPRFRACRTAWWPTSWPTSAPWRRSSGRHRASSRRWRAWARCGPARSARGCAVSRSRIWSIVT